MSPHLESQCPGSKEPDDTFRAGDNHGGLGDGESKHLSNLIIRKQGGFRAATAAWKGRKRGPREWGDNPTTMDSACGEEDNIAEGGGTQQLRASFQ